MLLYSLKNTQFFVEYKNESSRFIRDIFAREVFFLKRFFKFQIFALHTPAAFAAKFMNVISRGNRNRNYLQINGI